MALAIVGDLLLLAWVARGFQIARTAEDPLRRLSGFAPAVVEAVGFLFLPFLITALGYTIFVAWRYVRVKRWYVSRVRAQPARYVPTASGIVDDVVGRDELCTTLMENLRDRQATFPNLLVGDVGTGKTAVLVRLAQLLAGRGAVPVAVRLRDADRELDFCDLGFQAYRRELSGRLLSQGADADRTWQQLRRDNRAVVLADGLDEALAQADDRETSVQLAVRSATEAGLPLVIASRFDDPLRAVDAPIIELEPVGEGPALDYLTEGDATVDRHGCARLVQAADIADAPLYLRLLRELGRWEQSQRISPEQGWLTRLTSGFEGRLREGQPVDRVALRLRLLDDWKASLVKGYLLEDYALPAPRRSRTMTVLAALACVGLANDNLDVTFTDLTGARPDPGTGLPTGPGWVVARELRRRLAGLDEDIGPRTGDEAPPRVPSPDGGAGPDALSSECALAATMGDELGVVQQRGSAVRFRRSIIQAYLGSEFLGSALPDDSFLTSALSHCGQEFLLAVVWHSRRRLSPPPVEAPLEPGDAGGGTLRHSARVLAHIDRAVAEVRYQLAAGSIDWWRRLCAEAVRCHRERRSEDRLRALRLSAALVEVAGSPDPDSIGAILRGSDGPGLVGELAANWARYRQRDIQERNLLEGKRYLVRRIGETARLRAAHDGANGAADRPWLNYRDLYQMAVEEDEYAIQIAATEEIAKGRTRAFADLEPCFRAWWDWWQPYWVAGGEPRVPAPDDAGGLSVDEERKWREGVVNAWLAPLLFFNSTQDRLASGVTTSRPADLGPELANLKRWITEYLARTDPTHPEKRPWISLEIALAQGFRYAANIRPRNTAEDARRCALLTEQAEHALRHSRFWYAQLALIQALTLLSMPPDPGGKLKNRGHGSDPRELVRYWTGIAGAGFAELEHRAGHHSHPFVREAARLCRDALLAGRPAQFCWIDEEGTVGKVGSLQKPGALYEHQVWVLPSAGWSALTPRAQQLLGDVMLMLNLADRGSSPAQREERLSRADRPDLPPCLTRDARALDITRTVGSAKVSDPGASCHDDCLFRLCPYPPVGEKPFRAELTEGFCRQLSRNRMKLGYRKDMWTYDHQTFWRETARRARPRQRDERPGRAGPRWWRRVFHMPAWRTWMPYT